MRSILLLSFCIILAFTSAQNYKVCLTIDDLPLQRMSLYSPDGQAEVTGKILASLGSFRIPAVGFVNENKLFNGPELIPSRRLLLEAWLKSGMELGNHTWSHPDYNNHSFSAFKEEIRKGQLVMNELCPVYQKPVRYFRHPYLHRGNSKAKVDSLAQYLKTIGLTEAPVTMDNSEWIFAAAYDSAARADNAALMEQIGLAYIGYMEQKMHYFEKQSVQLFGRNISHVLLIHANALNSDYLDELAELFIRNRYEFVTLAEVLEDPAYQSEDTYYKSNGISWIHRWAITRGYGKEFFAGEPTTPDFVMKLARVPYE